MRLVDIQPLIPANVHQPLIPANVHQPLIPVVLGHNARESAESGGTIYYKHYYENKLFE